MLRYYEAERLLQPGRTPAGYRLYRAADLETVRRITMLNAAGLTLATIRALLPCARPGAPGFRPCTEFTAGLRRKLAELDRQIAALSESRQLLRGYLADSEQPPRAIPRRAAANQG
jgi:DNA-binding transcriptional MerR regulator